MKLKNWRNFIDNIDNVLIIHHWDADGISSAALITNILNKDEKKNITYCIPEIGTYNLIRKNNTGAGNIIIPEIKYDIIFVLDYSVPKDDIISFSKTMETPMVIYDHHLREPVEDNNISYNNPVAYGEDGRKWPSCTWVIKEALSLDINDLIVLGIAGDYEHRFHALMEKDFNKVKEYCLSSGHEYDDFIYAKEMIEVHYKTGNRDLLNIMATFLTEKGKNLEGILSEKKWEENLKSLKKEIIDIADNNEREIIGKSLVIINTETKNNIISAISRRLAKNSEYDYYMVINKGYFPSSGEGQIYVRRADKKNELNTSLFKKEAAELGFQVGGKDEVAGIIMPDDKTEEYITNIKKHFE